MAVIGLLVMVSVSLFVIGGLYPLFHRSVVVRRRLSQVQQPDGQLPERVSQPGGRLQTWGRRQTRPPNGPHRGGTRRGAAGSDHNRLGEIELWLRRADIHVRAADFSIRWAALTGVVTVLVALTPVPYLAVFAPILSVSCTWVYLRLRMARRLAQFDAGLYDLLILIANALRAGHSFVQALHLVAMESTGPIQEEVQRLEGELQMGVHLDDALERAAGRVSSEDFALIVTAIGIQRQIGGNLSEVLERIAETIGERVKLKREVKALTAQGRLSATIFMGLPAGVGLLLYMMNASYMEILFQSTLGLVLLIVAGLGQGMGYLLIRRIVRIDL